MSRSTRARWTNGVVLVGLAVAIAAVSWGEPFWGVVVPVLYAGAGLWASPIGDRHTHTQAEVQAMAGHERPVVVYARPGCSFCLRLRVVLLGAPQPVWVDIWDDPDAAAFVRSVNDGDETVPTVVVDDEVTTNPPPARVRNALQVAYAA